MAIMGHTQSDGVVDRDPTLAHKHRCAPNAMVVIVAAVTVAFVVRSDLLHFARRMSDAPGAPDCRVRRCASPCRTGIIEIVAAELRSR